MNIKRSQLVTKGYLPYILAGALLFLSGCSGEAGSSSKATSNNRVFYASDMADADNGELIRITFYESGKYEFLDGQLSSGAISAYGQRCGTYSMSGNQVTITYADTTSQTIKDINNFFVGTSYGGQSIPAAASDANAELLNSINIPGYSPCL